jgi:hypothetical protein
LRRITTSILLSFSSPIDHMGSLERANP